jgi:hypothetical protein
LQRTYTRFFALLLAISAILASSFMLMTAQIHATSHSTYTTSAKPAVAHLVSMHTANMAKVPVEKAKAFIPSPPELSDLPDVSSSVYDKYKAAAAHNPNAPVAPYSYKINQASSNRTSTTRVQTPGLTTSFQGMADSSSICPPSGCEVPDNALAASPNWVLQGVNTSFAVYNTSGNLQPG